MSSYERASSAINPKKTIVRVVRSTRGKFPGKRSQKGTVGVVWSSWMANSAWGTQKMSILDIDGNVTFTTRKCVEIAGDLSDYPDIKKSYLRHADTHFVPVFVQLKSFDGETYSESKRSLRVQYLGVSHFCFIPMTAVHPEDVRYVIQNPDERVYSLRVEPWVLQKHGII